MLKGKVAVVTGGTRGIGFATVKKFLENEAKVVLLGSKQETVEKAIKELKQINSSYEVIGFYPDLSSKEEMDEVFKKVKEIYGHIDILINNAGISSKTKIEDYTDEEYEKITNLNIKSVFNCSKEIIPYLKETKGVILNTSSMVSIYGQPSGVMYPTTKFAVNGITKSLARELAPYGIRVNAVAPGIINTDMVAKLPKEMIEPLIKTIPFGRIGEPEDIANAVMFLCSDGAKEMTGQNINVDSGIIRRQ